MLTVLFARPSHDLPTRYASFYLNKVIDQSRNLGFNVIDLKDELVTRRNFINYMMSLSPDVVIMTGHGYPTMITGWKGEPILKAGVDDTLLEGKTIIALSCLAGKELGKTLVERGAKAFLGFRKPFSFYFSSENPVNDDNANMFFRPPIEATLLLLRGSSIQEAYNRAIDLYNEEIKKAEESLFSRDLVETLKENRDNLVAYTREDLVNKRYLVYEP
jgi:hypothetical protein